MWIGNWGDEERSRELHEFLLEPIRELALTAAIYGVRYPAAALADIAKAGAQYRGWLPNHEVPAVLAAHRLTVHVPRRPYVEALPGIPTIRVFEAVACGVPLVSAPWLDSEGLFRPGDYSLARTGQEMKKAIRAVLNDPDLAAGLAARGLETIQARHTCAHRVEELLAICSSCGAPSATAATASLIDNALGPLPLLHCAEYRARPRYPCQAQVTRFFVGHAPRPVELLVLEAAVRTGTLVADLAIHVLQRPFRCDWRAKAAVGASTMTSLQIVRSCQRGSSGEAAGVSFPGALRLPTVNYASL